uniref:Uncharacterized protein n=1 Tax=Arundo donax TaxID=35708 RepID=A0A0A9HQK4_ARUDO
MLTKLTAMPPHQAQSPPSASSGTPQLPRLAASSVRMPQSPSSTTPHSSPA